MATPTTTPPKPDPTRASLMTVKRSGGSGRRSSVLRLDGISSNKIIDSNSTLPTEGMDRTGSFQDGGYMSMSGHGGGGSLTGNSSHQNEPSSSSLTGTGVGGAYSTRLQFPAKIYGREKELKLLKNIYYQKFCDTAIFADDGTATLDYGDMKSKSSTTNVDSSKGKNSSDNDTDQQKAPRPGTGPLEDTGESIASIQALADQIESTLDRAFDESTDDDAPAENDTGEDDDGEPQPSCILIGGYSGSGKTALVYSFARQINVEYSKVQKRLSQQSKQQQQQQQQDGKSVVSSATNESSKSTEELETNIKPCYFLTGKYEDNGVVGAEPFSALLDAFGGYCDALIDEIEEAQFVVIQAEEDAANNKGKVVVSDEDQKKVDAAKKKIEELIQFQKEIKDALKEEVTFMMNFVPGLRDFLEVTTDGERKEEEDEENDEEEKTTTEGGKSPATEELSFSTKKEFEFHKMAYVFKSFIKAICRASYPIVLFLDDVQWMDDASLRLVSDIVKDKRIKGLLVVGCFRSNEVDDDHPVSKTLLSHHSVERLDLPDLTSEEVGRFVADTLRLEVDECYTLTETIHNKTQGNIFFAKAAMEQFQEKKALYVSMNTMHWTWNMAEIEKISALSQNVVDVVTSKVARMPDKLQRALSLAAYLRSTFDCNTLLKLMQAEGHSIDFDELDGLLEKAVFEGLLSNNMGSRDYKFAHDRIKEACHALIPEGYVRDALVVRIGKFLVEFADAPDGEDWMIFVAADHLNSFPSNTGMTAFEMAKLNLRVGEKAVEVAAFVPASTYLHKAIEFMSKVDNPWGEHYDMILKLYEDAANVDLSLGRFEEGERFCEIILENAKHDNDKLRIYLTLGHALGRQEDHGPALDVHIKALQLIDAWPKRFHLVHMMRDFGRVKNYFKKHSNYEIMMLPTMTDERKSLVMAHLSGLSIRSFLCNKMPYVLLCILRQINMTIKYGMSPDSPHAFSSYGLVLYGTFGDAEGGSRMGRLARDTLAATRHVDRYLSKGRESHVIFTVSVYIDAWAVPIPQVLEELQRSHRLGMESGDLESGFRAWASSNAHAYTAGFPLEPILKMGVTLLEQMKLYKVHTMLASYLPFRWTLLHLMGKEEEPIDWTEVDRAPSEVTDVSLTFRWLWFYWSRIQIAFYFGKLEVAEKMIKPMAVLGAIDTCYLTTSIRIFFSGLTASSLARTTGKRKHKQYAKQATNEMHKLMKSRGLNNLHRYLLMKANLEACTNPKGKDVKDAYDRAISAASRAGFSQDAALGNELAGEHFLNIGDDFWPKHYFTRANQLYSEWGAEAKVDQLKATRGQYIEEDPRQTWAMRRNPSSTIESRHWMSGQEIEQLKALNWDLLSGQKPFKELHPTDITTPNLEGRGSDAHTVVSALTSPSGFTRNSLEQRESSSGNLDLSYRKKILTSLAKGSSGGGSSSNLD